MDITLHMLNGYLLASKAYLSAHLKENAEQETKPHQNNTMGIVGQPEVPEVTREELKNALLSAQVIMCNYARAFRVCSKMGGSLIWYQAMIALGRLKSERLGIRVGKAGRTFELAVLQ